MSILQSKDTMLKSYKSFEIKNLSENLLRLVLAIYFKQVVSTVEKKYLE